MKKSLIDFWKKTKLITDERIIEAFEKIPRENFILKEHIHQAYDDYPLPIGFEQTISQPTTIMIMTQALEAKQGYKILEIGSGSGYQAALLSYIVGEKGVVYTVEIIKELADFAKKNLKKCNIKNVKVIYSDGSRGLPKYAPFDGIIVTAACPATPKELINQLKDDGILIAPVGPLYNQEMLKIKKKGKNLDVKNLGDFIFVPLKGKYGY